LKGKTYFEQNSTGQNSRAFFFFFKELDLLQPLGKTGILIDSVRTIAFCSLLDFMDILSNFKENKKYKL
jgi:hypothetical protein